MLLQIKLVTTALAIAVAGIGTYSAYSYIKHTGYIEAELKYTQIIQDHVMQVNKKIDAIEALSNQLVAQDRKNSQLLAQDIAVIVKNTRNKPLTTTTKQGVCIPAPTFSDTLSNINQRANQSIKDKVQ
jgi:septal ring factor EnvC (AmiA/AmiB activator)